MHDDDSDWMSYHDARAHVEATRKCYREKAIDLLQEAADSGAVRTRTVDSSPKWLNAGNRFYLHDGKDVVEFFRKDVRRHFTEHQEDAPRSPPPQAPTRETSDAIRRAIEALRPDQDPTMLRAGQQLMKDICALVKVNEGRDLSHHDISRTTQRVLKKMRFAWKK